MIYKEKTYTRPRADTPWHNTILTTDEHRIYLLDTYINTGKILFKSKNISGDELSLTIIYGFDSQEALDSYEADPVVIAYMEARKEYNSINYIIEGKKIITID